MTAKKAAGRSKSLWLDEMASTPVIDEQARRLDTFLLAIADGKIETSELKAQEKRLVSSMKEVEPMLNEELHEKVTQLLCELTAYNLMQVMHTMHEMRPKTVFRG